MNSPTSRRSRLTATAALVTLLVACGGGAVALLPLVTPIGGAWNLDGNVATPQLEQVAGEFFSLVPKEDTPYLLDSPVAVQGSYATTAPALFCAGLDSAEVEGTIDDGDLVLYLDNGLRDTVCLRGRFSDLATFRASDGRIYRNRRVDVRFDIGVWVNADQPAQRFKFTAPDSVNNDEQADIVGCELVAAGTRPVIGGTLLGYVTENGDPPAIPALLRDGVALFTGGVLVDGATIEFDGPAGKVTLRREAADDGDTCS